MKELRKRKPQYKKRFIARVIEWLLYFVCERTVDGLVQNLNHNTRMRAHTNAVITCTHFLFVQELKDISFLMTDVSTELPSHRLVFEINS